MDALNEQHVELLKHYEFRAKEHVTIQQRQQDQIDGLLQSLKLVSEHVVQLHRQNHSLQMENSRLVKAKQDAEATLTRISYPVKS